MIAEAYYGIPDDLKQTALSYLDERLLDITESFDEKYSTQKRTSLGTLRKNILKFFQKQKVIIT